MKLPVKITNNEIRKALVNLCFKIESCGASTELTNAVVLCSDLADAVGDDLNPADDYALQRVRDAI